ncbi:hypothetical protein ACEQ8H_002192 [Pleosporales sp. CAS-2024a]
MLATGRCAPASRHCSRAACAPRRVASPWRGARSTACRVARHASASARASPTTLLPTIRPLTGAIIIPGSVAYADWRRMLDHIVEVPVIDVARKTFCVFLVTPSFASWLTNEHEFVAAALRKAYSRTRAHHTVAALCAVVDKLPAGSFVDNDLETDGVVRDRTLQPPVGQTGYEGFAYAILPSTASVPASSPPSVEKGAIDFIMAGQGHVDTWRLPLANTVFQTGSPTTMYYTEWDVCRALRIQTKCIKKKRVDVTHHGVIMSTPMSDGMLSALSVPLLPLTLPRQVEGCMGNIISRVTGHDGTSLTASAELESVVPQFFKARGEPVQPTTAWALVIPQDKQGRVRRKTMSLLLGSKGESSSTMDETDKQDKLGRMAHWEKLWNTKPVIWNDIVSTSLGLGARLHRVLSGGGGWGKKAGLLSLDPVPVAEEVPIRMEDATSNLDGPGTFSDALTPVVQNGDAIQFFISPTSEPKPEEAKDVEFVQDIKQSESLKALAALKAIPKGKNHNHGWELGVIPSTVDAIPGNSWQDVLKEEKYIAIFKNAFGALSEGGMTLTRRRSMWNGASTRPFKTTVDVPYSRLWCVSRFNPNFSPIAKVSVGKDSYRSAVGKDSYRGPVSKDSYRGPVGKDSNQSSIGKDDTQSSVNYLQPNWRPSPKLYIRHMKSDKAEKVKTPIWRFFTTTNNNHDVRPGLGRQNVVEDAKLHIRRPASRSSTDAGPEIGSVKDDVTRKTTIRRITVHSGDRTSKAVEAPTPRVVPSETKQRERSKSFMLRKHFGKGKVRLQKLNAKGLRITPMMENATQKYISRPRFHRYPARDRTSQSKIRFTRLRRRDVLGRVQTSRKSLQPRIRRQVTDGAFIVKQWHGSGRQQSLRVRRLKSGGHAHEMPTPRRSKKQLLETVSSWLGEAPTTSKEVKAARRAGRPFGSGALDKAKEAEHHGSHDFMVGRPKRHGLSSLLLNVDGDRK